MAQKYRKIDPRIWGDEKFRELAPDEQRIAFYILTSNQANRIGLFRFSLTLAAEDLAMELDLFRQRFRNVIEKFDWPYDDGARVLYLDTWWKYNLPDNPNILIGNLEDLHDLPETPLAHEFAANHRYLSPKLAEKLCETLAERFAIVCETSRAGAGAGAGSGSITGNISSGGGAPREINGETILNFDSKGGGTWPLTREKLGELAATFTTIDVEQEAREAWQYLRDNPAKRKLPGELAEFLRRWMKRSSSPAAGNPPHPINKSAPASETKHEQRRARNAAAVAAATATGGRRR